MPKQQSGVNARGIGLELARLREGRGLSVRALAKRVGFSASKLSRIENGKQEPASEDVASILTVLEVFGVEREQMIERARRSDQPDMLESTTSTEQSRNFLNFEQKAIKLVDFELMLVPGLAQTPDYAHAVLSSLRMIDNDEELEPLVGLRMRRQAILTRRNPPQLHWILTEVGLRQLIGGPRVMRKQIAHLIDLVERPNITVNVLPADVAQHPGLLGQFIIMDFADGPAVVHVEDTTTGLFLDDPDKVALYRLRAEKLTGLALDEQRSLRLLESIARDLDRE